MPKYVAAIDQGTTSTRFVIFDSVGNIIALDQKEHKQIYPKPGWVEHDPIEIWENTKSVMSGALNQLAGSSQSAVGNIVAVGVTNQRETTVVWEKGTGRPIHNAIVWQDIRTESICKTLARNGGKERFQSKTGLPLAPYFSGPKISWILDNIAGARTKAERGELLFGNIDTWLIWNLTGGTHTTDVTNASRTLLMDLATLEWDDEILKVLGIPLSMLPTIRSSSEIYGLIDLRLSHSSLPNIQDPESTLQGIPVCGDLGDQQAALFGQSCYGVGEAKNTYGTGCFMLLNTGGTPVRSKAGLLSTVAYKVGSQQAVYALEGSIAIAGALVQWLRDNLGLIHESAEVEDLAKTVADNGGIYFVPAFSGLYAPYWRSEARGVIVGMTRFVNKGHIARASLEATAFQTLEVIDAMEKDSGVKITALKVDGGMVFNELLMQFQADILDVPLIRPKVTETTALGAAYVAGLAIGYWKDLDILRRNWSEDKRWKPQMFSVTRDELYASWKKAVTRTFDWAG